MKQVYKLSSSPVTRYTLSNDGASDVQNNHSAKSNSVENEKKLDSVETSQNNVSQYRVITVPGHNIKILNVKKTILPCQPSIKVPMIPSSSSTNLMYKLPSSSSSSVVSDKEVTKLMTAKPISSASSAISADKIAKNLNKKEEESDTQLISPSSRWISQPRSYRGAKKDYSQRKIVRKISVSSFVDTTDGETSGMGSSVDEPVESSTESASEAPPSFLQPRQSSRPMSISPSAVKKRRGGWPKGRKRKPEPPGTKTPKAPQTAYVLFLNERRKFYKETHPNLPFVEVTKLLGAEWSSMTQAQKAVYITRSEQDKKRYRNELQTFRQSPDYQILLRKKRIKNALNRGQTTEESSDFTDEVDDDDSEELHCRTCDQWFTSIHNKREHLYGKPHLQAITGEYQREREAEMRRRMASPTFENLQSLKLEDKKTIPEIRIENEDEQHEDKPIILDGCCGRRDSIGLTSTTEDDRDDDDDDDDGDVDDEEEEDSEYDDEGEVTEEEEGSSKVSKEPYGSYGFYNERVTDAAEGVISKVLNREMEIRFLRNRYEKSRRNQRQIYATLATLQTKQKLLQEQQERLIHEEKTLMEKAESLAKISELCKNGIQLRNSERESDELERQIASYTSDELECQIGPYTSDEMEPQIGPYTSDELEPQIGPYTSDELEPQIGSYTSTADSPNEKLFKICDSSNCVLSPDLNSFSASQEISNGGPYVNSIKNEDDLVLSNQMINNSVDYTELSQDLLSGEDLDKTHVIGKEISGVEVNVTKAGREPVHEMVQECQSTFNSQIGSKDSITSKIKVDIGKPSLNELDRYSIALPSTSTKYNTEHSYSKVNYTSIPFSKKKRNNCKKSCNSLLVDRNIHPESFGGTKFKKSASELLKPINDSVENMKVIEPSSLHSQRHLESIYKQDSLSHTQLNTSQSHLALNMTQTVTKLCIKETLTTKSVDPFHSIKEKPPNIVKTQQTLEDTNDHQNVKDVNSSDLNSNDTGNTDKFYFPNEIIPLEDSSDLDYYINNFTQEDCLDSVSKLLTISEADLLWEDVSKAQKFRYNMNTLPSLDNIFEEDDSIDNILSDTS